MLLGIRIGVDIVLLGPEGVAGIQILEPLHKICPVKLSIARVTEQGQGNNIFSDQFKKMMHCNIFFLTRPTKGLCYYSIISSGTVWKNDTALIPLFHEPEELAEVRIKAQINKPTRRNPDGTRKHYKTDAQISEDTFSEQL